MEGGTNASLDLFLGQEPCPSPNRAFARTWRGRTTLLWGISPGPGRVPTSSSIRLLRVWEGRQDAEHIKGGVAAEPGTASGRKPGVGPLSTSRRHGKAKGAMPCNIGVDMWHANDR